MASGKPWKMTEQLRREIYRSALRPQTGVSLRQMVQFGPRPSQGTLFHGSHFAVEELPIRLSHRVRELEELPHGLADEPSIRLVRDWYAQSYEELKQVKTPSLSKELCELLQICPTEKTEDPALDSLAEESGVDYGKEWVFQDDGVIVNRKHKQPQSSSSGTSPESNRNLHRYYVNLPKDYLYPNEVVNYNRHVTEVLIKIKERHDATVTTLAKGVQSWKKKNANGYVDTDINQFLDRFYMSRIGIRMLIGQTIALNLQAQKRMQDDDYVGIISLKCNISDIAEDAIDAARFACEQHFNIMDVPQVKLHCPPDLTFGYVPGHLVHMLYETLKNSLRATIEHHSKLHPEAESLEDIEYPPIKIIVAKGDEDITIKISDEGGGIPRSAVPLVWTYFYTSANNNSNGEGGGVDLLDDLNSDRAPFMGLGVGLPHSRLYARYFHGDLKLISMEGYGTDVYLHLNRLTSSSEPLY